MIGGLLLGARTMQEKLKRIAAKFPDRVAAALKLEAEIEATEMKRRTPVDTTPNAPHPGQLRASIFVGDPEREGRRIWIVIATGRHVDEYAIYVHENPDAIHPVGQWQFMASVISESRSHMLARIAARIQLNKGDV